MEKALSRVFTRMATGSRPLSEIPRQAVAAYSFKCPNWCVYAHISQSGPPSKSLAGRAAPGPSRCKSAQKVVS